MVRWDDGSRHRRWTSITSILCSNFGAGWLKSETTRPSESWRGTWIACRLCQLACQRLHAVAGEPRKRLHEAGSGIDRGAAADRRIVVVPKRSRIGAAAKAKMASR